jgi:hypothetical protein
MALCACVIMAEMDTVDWVGDEGDAVPDIFTTFNCKKYSSHSAALLDCRQLWEKNRDKTTSFCPVMPQAQPRNVTGPWAGSAPLLGQHWVCSERSA